jgi:hypothetical protein
MAHFAELDEGNIVKRVVVINNETILDEQGNESEAKGVEFLRSLYGSGTWLQTSYNQNFRGKMASVGDIYSSARDKFIPMKPYPSWTYDEDSNTWQPPVPFPANATQPHSWDEITQVWVPSQI